MYMFSDKSASATTTAFIIFVISIIAISEANPLPRRAHEFIRNRGYGRQRRELDESEGQQRFGIGISNNNKVPNFVDDGNNLQVDESRLPHNDTKEIPSSSGHGEGNRSRGFASRTLQVNSFRRDETIIEYEVDKHGRLLHQIIKEELDSKRLEPRWT